MSLQDTSVIHKVFWNGEPAGLDIPELLYLDSIASGWNKVTVSGSAADEAVAIGDYGTTKLIFLKVKPTDVNKITVKINGSSKAYKVSPLAAFSDNLSALTASNSSTSAVDLFYTVIYV